MTTELITNLCMLEAIWGGHAGDIGKQAADTIERLEAEAVAATLRIENDATTISNLRSVIRDALAETLEYRQAADSMAAAHKVERDAMFLELTRTRQDISGALMEIEPLKLDAARYQWITKHIVSGELDNLERAFAVFGDDESVTLEAFNSALDAAMGDAT